MQFNHNLKDLVQVLVLRKKKNVTSLAKCWKWYEETISINTYTPLPRLCPLSRALCSLYNSIETPSLGLCQSHMALLGTPGCHYRICSQYR